MHYPVTARHQARPDDSWQVSVRQPSPPHWLVIHIHASSIPPSGKRLEPHGRVRLEAFIRAVESKRQ